MNPDLRYYNEAQDYYNYSAAPSPYAYPPPPPPYNSDTYEIKPSCNKCNGYLKKMNYSPGDWICDHWNPPYTSCESGNGIKLNNNTRSYCCENTNSCTYTICEKCYNYSYSKLKREIEHKYNNMKEIQEQEEEEEEHQNCNCNKPSPYPTDFSKFPLVKKIKGHQEMLDLTKGFFLTQPDCTNRYPNTCKLGGEKPVNQMWEGKYSVLDLGKDCLYDEHNKEYRKIFNNSSYGCDGKNDDVAPVLKDDKCRKEKGLINILGNVQPKQYDEATFQYPIPLFKTKTCVPINTNHQSMPEIHNIDPKKMHTHFYPDKNVMVKYTHRHSTKPHKPKSGINGSRPPYPSNRGLQFTMFNKPATVTLTSGNKPTRGQGFKMF